MKAVSISLMAGIASLFNSTLAIAQDKPLVVSNGKQIEFAKYAATESATIFAFYKPASTLESEFIDQLKKNASPKIAIRLIALTTGEEPVAKQYDIIRTPTAIVIDRRGRVTGRSSKADDIRQFAMKAARVMRIDWAEEGTDLYAAADKATGSKGLKPGIMRTLSLQPEWLKQFYTLTRMSHFEDSHLTRKSKEMIATYVSGLNKCKF